MPCPWSQFLDAILQLPVPADLIRDPDAGGVGDPLSGMDPSVNPDGLAI